MTAKLIALAATYTDKIDRAKFTDSLVRGFYSALQLRMPYGKFITDDGITYEEKELIDKYKDYLRSIGKYKK